MSLMQYLAILNKQYYVAHTGGEEEGERGGKDGKRERGRKIRKGGGYEREGDCIVTCWL